MISPLEKTTLHDLAGRPILLDANVLMVGIGERALDPKYSFESMRALYLEPLFESFSDILIHEEVYHELDKEAQAFVDSYLGKNVRLVGENGLYGADPQYTTIFNSIAEHELVRYDRRNSKDRGEVFSMAYAAFHNVSYFCSRDAMADLVSDDLAELRDISIVTFDVVILAAYVYHREKGDLSDAQKALKAVYKTYCEDVIRRHRLPKKLSDYIEAFKAYL